MENLEIYNRVRAVPKEAQKVIGGGRLKGMTDINPMWRIRTLTEEFGPAGIGWYYDIDREWLEPGANGEVTAHIRISLYIKHGEEWSRPIRGIGGSTLVSKELKGLNTDDECYKKALTDALSVACKALGIGADIYWDRDPTKYTQRPRGEKAPEQRCEICGDVIRGLKLPDGTQIGAADVAGRIQQKTGGRLLCKKCQEALNT